MISISKYGNKYLLIFNLMLIPTIVSLCKCNSSSVSELISLMLVSCIENLIPNRVSSRLPFLENFEMSLNESTDGSFNAIPIIDSIFLHLESALKLSADNAQYC